MTQPPDDLSPETGADEVAALRRELAATRQQLERSERYRARLETLKEQSEALQRRVNDELRAAQDALERARRELEHRVEARTHELSQSNAALHTEIGERRRAETELRRQSAELAATRDAAVAASRAKSTFLANMSHELRTPLNAILGYAELIADDADDAPLAGFRGDLGRICGAARHLLAIIDDLLDLAKIEAGRLELRLQTFAVDALVDEVAATARPLVARGGNSFTVDVSPRAGVVRCDQQKLRQTLLNLLGNAAKFTAAGAVSLRVEREGDWLAFVVADTGIGIPPDKLSTLFRPFEQVDPSATRRHGGAGLGLALSLEFTRMLGGTITVRSAPGRGSSFAVQLPAPDLRAPADDPARAEQPAP